MKQSLLVVLAVMLFTLTAISGDQDHAVMPDASLVDMPDDPKLPRVLLIGDSISEDYTVPVRRLLQGQANVHHIPMNGSTTLVGLENLSAWLGHEKWDVIHFNWGLHDLTVLLGQGGLKNDGSYLVPLDRYQKNLEELVRRLKLTGAKLVWATTTPVPDAPVSHLLRRHDDVPAYNAVALKIMDENGIAIDDLYSFALPRLTEIQMPANVHFTDYGSELLAQRIAASILTAMEKQGVQKKR